MRYFCYTNKGLERSRNEDAFFVDKNIVQEGEIQGESFFVCGVSDGIGGLDDGDRASMEVSRYFSSNINPRYGLTKTLVKSLNNHILKTFSNNSGATFVAASIKNNKLQGVNVGDSRCYILIDGIFFQLSIDDKDGLYDEHTNVISNYLGNPDFNIEEAHFFTQDINEGAQFFFCSDGVTNYIDESLLSEILQKNDSFEDCREKINKEIFRNGAKDNFSYIIVRF